MHTNLISMLLLWFGLLGGAGFAFLTQLLLARTISVAEMGTIAGVMSLMLLAMPLSEFGISGLWLRLFGRDGKEAFLWIKPSLYTVLSSSGVVIVGVLLVGHWAWEDQQQRLLLHWLLILPPMEALVVLVGARIQLEGRYRFLSLWRAVPKFSRLLVVVMAWIVGFDVEVIVFGYCMLSIIVLLIAAIQLIPMINGTLKLEKHVKAQQEHTAESGKKSIRFQFTIINVISKAWPFAMGNIFSLIYLQSDIFMLSALCGPKLTALYSVAFSFLALVYLLPTAIFYQFLLPRYHRWAEHDPTKLLLAYRLGNGYMIVFGLIVMLLLVWLSPFLIEWAFGEKYTEAGKVIQLLALCVPFRYLAASFGSCLVTQDHMRRKVKYQMVVAIFNVGLNLLLIPKYGMYGAASTTVASEVMLCLIYLIGVWRHLFGLEAIRGWTLNYKLIANETKRYH